MSFTKVQIIHMVVEAILLVGLTAFVVVKSNQQRAKINELENEFKKKCIKIYTLESQESIKKIGLLAQDIKKVFPALVKQSGDKKGTLSVNYQGFVPILINAIKEQQKEIKSLKKQLNIL